jgi:hypothetical protein
MRITQCYSILRFFKPHVFKKYGFKEYTNPRQPAVFWGCYASSKRKLISHNALAVVVWRGSDAMQSLKDASFVKWLQAQPNIHHIAISNYIERDLDRVGIPYISLPITSMDFTHCRLMPRGTMLYTYGAENDGALIKYQAALSREVSLKTGVALHTAHKDSFPRNMLIHSLYRDCFLGLRLLNHDGLSNTVVELGLCGRNVVYNGATPNALHWRDTKDIIQIVQTEQAHRKEDNAHIAQDMNNFINISFEWLNVKFWEEKL